MDTCEMWWWGGEARVKARGRRACEAVAASVGGKGRGLRREVRGRRPARDQGARGGMGGLSGDEVGG
jgi:hypothetical protein